VPGDFHGKKISHLGHQCERGPPVAMATSLAALSDDDIRAGVDCLKGV
jgi:hypothetical protein